MSRKDCKHTNSVLPKFKDAIRQSKGTPEKQFCTQCQQWLKSNEIVELWNRAKQEIKEEQDRLRELAEHNKDD